MGYINYVLSTQRKLKEYLPYTSYSERKLVTFQLAQREAKAELTPHPQFPPSASSNFIMFPLRHWHSGSLLSVKVRQDVLSVESKERKCGKEKGEKHIK